MTEENSQTNFSVKNTINDVKTEIKQMPKRKLVLRIILMLIAVFVLVQIFNADKYEAVVRVVEGEKIGVNPTDLRLDFGDLPKDKSAVRTVNLQNHSPYRVKSYIIVWKFGELAELMDISQNFFTIKPKEEVKLEFTAHMPNSSEFREYKGKVWVFQIPKPW